MNAETERMAAPPPVSEEEGRRLLNQILEVTPKSGVAPKNMDELIHLAKCQRQAITDNLPPNVDRRKVDTVSTIIMKAQHGADLGFSFATSQRCVYIFYSKGGVQVGLMGHAVMALIWASGLVERYEHGWAGEGDDHHAWIRVRRRGGIDMRYSYSLAMARAAGLYQNEEKPKEPWEKHPDDMLLWRCISRMGATLFPDVVHGLGIAEVMRADTDTWSSAPVRGKPATFDRPAQTDPLLDSATQAQGGGEDAGSSPSPELTPDVVSAAVETDEQFGAKIAAKIAADPERARDYYMGDITSIGGGGGPGETTPRTGEAPAAAPAMEDATSAQCAECARTFAPGELNDDGYCSACVDRMLADAEGT